MLVSEKWQGLSVMLSVVLTIWMSQHRAPIVTCCWTHLDWVLCVCTQGH